MKILGFEISRKKEPVVKIETISFTDPYDNGQMQALASLYAGKHITDFEFQQLLSGKEIDIKLEGGLAANLVETAFIVDDEEHLVLERRASKEQKKKFADNRTLCTVMSPPEIVGDDEALSRYGKVFQYEKLFKQLYAKDTSKSERKALLKEAMEIFYPQYKKFEDKKPENKQAAQRPDEPILKKFKANGWRTLADTLSVTVEDLLEMKPKARAKFLEDLLAAAENCSARYEWLVRILAQEAAESTKDSEVWAALIWHFKKADPDKVDALNEMKDESVKCTTAAKLSGLCEEEVTDIVEKYRIWQESRDKKKGKDGKGKKDQKQQQSKSSDDDDSSSNSGKGPYAGITVDGIVAEIVAKKSIDVKDDKVKTEIIMELYDKAANFGKNDDCPIQEVYSTLFGYEAMNDIASGTANTVADALAKVASVPQI